MNVYLSEWIDRHADEVYEYAADPANLPQWAPGLGSSVEKVEDRWFVETSSGRVGFAFVQRNEYGVLDHYVTLPSGQVVYNPMRVIADQSGYQVVFTLRRQPGTSDEDFRADTDAVSAELTRFSKGLKSGVRTVRHDHSRSAARPTRPLSCANQAILTFSILHSRGR
jgi:hypothetical protein